MKTFRIFAAIAVYSFLFALDVQGREQTQAKEGERFSSVFIADARLKDLKGFIGERREPTYSAFQALRQYAEDNLARKPNVPENWYVPGYYQDREGHREAKNVLRDDANTAYALALCFRITGEKKYARPAVKIIDAWTSGIKTMSRRDDSALSFGCHFPVLIFAADLLRNESVWDKTRQEAFKTFLRDDALPMNTMARANNWGNWGMVLAVSCAVYLRDEELFDECADRWKFFVDSQIAADGSLPREVIRSGGRQGVGYSHFCLMPQTIAAEILRINGRNLYDYESELGGSLKKAFERLAGWTRRPDTFPYWEGAPSELKGVQYFSYFEILNTRWPNRDASKLLGPARPMTANHAAPFLTFTHGQVVSNEKD